MPVQSARLIPYSLPLRQQWQSSMGGFGRREGWLVELSCMSGVKGYGDCAPLPLAGTEAAKVARQWLDEQLSLMKGKSPSELLRRYATETPYPPAAHFALETALLDLACQSEQITLRHWLNKKAADHILVNAVIGSLDDSVQQRAANKIQQGFTTLKIKVGMNSPQDEITQLHELAQQLPKKTRLRLDANRAWNSRDAEYFIDGVRGLPIDSLEEPLREPDLKLLAKLQNRADCSLALDESLAQLHIDKLLAHPPVKRFILKPMVIGSLLSTKKLAESAANASVECVVTTTVDSAVGVLATAQLAAAIPTSQPLSHGLTTSEWLAEDISDPLAIINGEMVLPDTHGLGIGSVATA
ncbi:MAG: o-succinylbenzoate synthase [gamma proteobacterium endosymbiont of Lamellibrachia anaximandri]|nr:o-succinylbenzoate synthase [gamma proteobacterium endosymbiont of Lamellibrachia anaximandri]MBL3533425.1 o-succinylbenzoate synthase [gamma proteobacterium endosymbiont of Lamellibrachia anaximandri]